MIMTRTTITICTSTVATTGTRTMEKITPSIAGIAQQVQKWSHQVSVNLCVQHSGFGSFQDLFGAWYDNLVWSGLDWWWWQWWDQHGSKWADHDRCIDISKPCRRMISDPRPLQSLFAGNAVFVFILDFILFFVQTYSRRYLFFGANFEFLLLCYFCACYFTCFLTNLQLSG